MTKKMTLDETWKNCLAMWEWIAEKWAQGYRDIHKLKGEWLTEHGFGEEDNVRCNCFFCEAAGNPGCDACPARLVDDSFWCQGPECDWRDSPIEFCQRLLQLNEIRLAKKRDK